MKLAIAPEHCQFFEKELQIEFEELFDEEQLIEITLGLEEVLKERLGVPVSEVGPDKLYLKGRDLWRSHPVIKGIVLEKRFAEVAGALLGKRPIRIGYDQLFEGSRQGGHPFLDQELTLLEMSSLQGVVGGLMLCLQGNDEIVTKSNTVFSARPGNGVFFAPNFPLNLKELQKRPSCRYLLITYAHSMTAYIHKKNDPHTNALKSWGYGIGDPLTNVKNPIVYK